MAKSRKPRVEELYRFIPDQIIKAKPHARHFFDIGADRYTFDDVMLKDGWHLVLFINGRQTTKAYRIEEIDQCFIMPVGQRSVYYVRHNGKRYRYLYLNPKTGEVGTKDELDAVWTSEHIYYKKRAAWRQQQNARKRKHYKKVTSPEGLLAARRRAPPPR